MEAQPTPQTPGTISLDPRYTDTTFTRVPNWVLEKLGTISRDARYTFIVLLKYARQDGHCWPGMDRLTADLGASRQSVHHWIKELEMAGLVEVVRCGRGRSNDYRFHWPDWLDNDVNHADVNNALPQDEVNPALRQSQHVNPALRQTGDDVKQADNDVKQAFPYVDATTKTQRTLVPPVDISIKVDASARNARAREAPSPLSKSEVDPLPRQTGEADWALDMALRLYEHWGGDPAEGVPADWCECLQQNLRDCTGTERDDFLSYVLSNGILRGISSPRGVCTVLGQDAKHWKLRGKPSSKNSVPAPQVPAHVQWEHDHAHNPRRPSPARCVHCKRCIEHGEDHARDCPTEVRRLADQLRKVGRNKDADDYLRKHGLLRESHATG